MKGEKVKIERLTYRIWKGLSAVSLILLSLVLLLTACRDDVAEGKRHPNVRKQRITVLTGTSSFVEVNPTPTRALPDNYSSYSPAASIVNSDIALFLTTGGSEFVYDNAHNSGNKVTYDPVFAKWTADITVDQSQSDYYVYGYMPMMTGVTSVLNKQTSSTTYVDGCQLQLKDVETLTSNDVCAIVGIGESDDPNELQNRTRLGRFHYDPSNTYMLLLLKHLYAGLHFKAHIDTEYAKLRSIKVKKMTLKSVNEVADKADIAITITANDLGDDPISDVNTDIRFTPSDNSSTTSVELDLYNDPDNPFELPTQTMREFLSCFTPGTCTSFELTSNYDVYDRKGNLIREGCTAKNKIQSTSAMSITTMRPGDIYTIDLLVQPTYLYVLSDPDLDNPTFTVITGN